MMTPERIKELRCIFVSAQRNEIPAQFSSDEWTELFKFIEEILEENKLRLATIRDLMRMNADLLTEIKALYVSNSN